MTTTYLDKILRAHRDHASTDDRPLEGLIEQARAVQPARGFRRALLDADGLAVISEIKRWSPSKGPINPDVDPATWAASYASGDA